jgi:hypothetical protein
MRTRLLSVTGSLMIIGFVSANCHAAPEDWYATQTVQGPFCTWQYLKNSRYPSLSQSLHVSLCLRPDANGTSLVESSNTHVTWEGEPGNPVQYWYYPRMPAEQQWVRGQGGHTAYIEAQQVPEDFWVEMTAAWRSYGISRAFVVPNRQGTGRDLNQL